MSRRWDHFRNVALSLAGLTFGASFVSASGQSVLAVPRDGKDSLVEPARTDPRLKGITVPKGFKVRLVATEPAVVDPAAMAFDDMGNLFVAEWKPAERSFETWETLALPEGGSTRIRRSRKTSTDVVKRLKDVDGDGVYESSEVVIEGCELPTAILCWKNHLYLACVGRLEKWSDEDGDGKFETRTILADGFAALDRRGLSGITLGTDGWLYLTTGDNDNRVVGSDGSRVDLLRTGGVIRCRPDGSKLSVFAMGLRNPYRGVSFDGSFRPFLLDGDQEDGSKFQGVRLVNPVEEGDYGWRLRAGLSSGAADFDRSAVNGERPGKLPVLARLGRGAPSGATIYHGSALPASFRETLFEADPARRVVRGYKLAPKGDSISVAGDFVLMKAEDDQFRPVQVVVGADGALYVLDRRGRSPDDSPAWGEGKAGRIYQLTWQGDDSAPARPLKPNNWQRVIQADFSKLVFEYMASADFAEADRAQRELIDRGPSAVTTCLAYAANPAASLHARLLGIQGARQFWSDPVEDTLIRLLGDPEPDIRRLAAQALAWEPKNASLKILPKLVSRLDDSDGRVVREVALAIGRHAEVRAQQTAAILTRWLYAHPKAEPTVKDAFLRALERLGEAGVEEVALAVRTRRGVEQETAVAWFTALRTAPAAEQLEGLVKIPDLSSSQRLALIHQFQDIPNGIPVPTQGLADWVAKHAEVGPAVKVAALEACRLGGNPASTLVLALLDDEDESVRQAAIAIAARSRPPGAVEKLLARINAREIAPEERLAIVRALGSAGPKAFAPLDRLFLAVGDPELRKAALRSMADSDRVKATPALESALAGPDPSLRAEAAHILGESPKTVGLLAKAFLNRTIGRNDLPAVLAALRKQDSAESRKMLAAIEDDAIRGSGAINPAEIRTRLTQDADPWAGLGVFFRESSQCSTCHQVEARGLAFGPDLTLRKSPLSADQLIDSILAPSREIGERHQTSKVNLKDGRVLTGIVVSSSSKLVSLKENAAREYRIPVEAIVSQATEPTSLMSPSLAMELTPDELADVVAFLQSKPAQESLRHGPRRLDRVLAIGPFPLGADRLRVALDRVEQGRPMVGLDGESLTWQTREASRWGTLNLRGDLGSRPGRAYLAVEVQSPSEQVAALRLGVEGAARVYLNGARIAELPERSAASLAHAFDRPREGCLATLPDLARLALKPGANLLIVAIDSTGLTETRASFEIAAPEPVEIGLPRP